MILVSLAACGDDGNPGTNTVCGDGTREGAEQCDDGNTAAGDGCSATCTTELSMSCGNGAVEGTEQCDDGNITSGDGCSATCTTEGSMTCGNGTVEGTEECDDNNTTSGDGCSMTCQDEAPPVDCGNGMPNTGETCDDGDTMGGDGCSATCQTEVGYTCTPATASAPSVCTMATPAGTCAAPFVVNFTGTTVLTATLTGNTTTSTDQVMMADCDGDPDAGAGKDHVWRFTTTGVRDISIELSDTGTTDTVVRLMTAPCDPMTEVIEYPGNDGCVDFSGSGEIMEFVALPAGTYYVLIDGYTADAADQGAYSFTVTARPTLCGNGVIDPISAIAGAPDEFCDDGDGMSGDGCDSRCEQEPGYTCVDSTTPPPASVCTQTCGNGMPDAGETCDDGDTMGTDGCSATCQTETGFTCTTATTTVPSVCTMIMCGNGVNETGETCDDGNMTASDGCSATCQTEAGFTCTVGTGVATPSVCTMSCGDGTLQAAEECEDGNNTNGDRCSATCTLEFDTAEVEPGNNTTAQVLTAGNHIIKGALTAGDVDLYTFTLAAPATIHLETYDRMNNIADYAGVGTLTNVDCLATDSVVRLFAMGSDVTMDAMAAFSDDDDGDLGCSYLGPQDSDQDDVPNDIANPNEGVLAAGTYTIKVTHFSSTGTSARYLLDLKIVSATALAPVVGDLVLNEYMAADGTTADSNCDGSTTGTNDEFIELVNSSTTKTLDLGGVQVHDMQVGLRHTLAGGTFLPPGKALVVWSGGAPACPGVNYFATTSGGLGLNDSGGDAVIVKPAGAVGADLINFPYTTTTAGVSANRSPDITGATFVLHTAVAGAVGSFSPGKRSDNTAF